MQAQAEAAKSHSRSRATRAEHYGEGQAMSGDTGHDYDIQQQQQILAQIQEQGAFMNEQQRRQTVGSTQGKPDNGGSQSKSRGRQHQSKLSTN